MKRTWVVYIEQGIGHENHNEITESEWYGPFTESQARRLEKELNEVFEMDEDVEHQIATALPLEEISPRELLKRYKIAAAEGSD